VRLRVKSSCYAEPPPSQRAVIIIHHPTQRLPSAFRLSSQPTNQPPIQPTNQRPSCRPSFRPSNQLQFRCKASLALNQPPITTNLRTLQPPGLTLRMPSQELAASATFGWRVSHLALPSLRWRTGGMQLMHARSWMEHGFVATV